MKVSKKYKIKLDAFNSLLLLNHYWMPIIPNIRWHPTLIYYWISSNLHTNSNTIEFMIILTTN